VHRDVLAHFGVRGLSDEEVAKRTFGRIADAAREYGVPEDKIEEVHALNAKLGSERVALAPLYPQAVEFLQALKWRGRKIALLTSNYRQVVDIALGHHNLLEFFDLVVTSDDVTKYKPHPEGILFCLEKFGVAKDKVLMLGDSDSDLGAAKNAGVDSVLFYPLAHELFHDKRRLQEEFGPRFTISS
jgi:HAD superfamily hydrolase (TIGR01549 family)